MSEKTGGGAAAAAAPAIVTKGCFVPRKRKRKLSDFGDDDADLHSFGLVDRQTNKQTHTHFRLERAHLKITLRIVVKGDECSDDD